MPGTIAKASLLDDLRFNLSHVLPNFLQGLFRRNRFWVGFFSRLHRDPLGVRFGQRLRRKYRARYVRLHMLVTPTILVLDAEGARRVLEHSPAVYAEPRSKWRGMSHFQPGALTISRDSDWENRRRFNEAVLRPDTLHSSADRFLAVIRDEVRRGRDKWSPTLLWADVEELFRCVTLRVIFGDRARDDTALTHALDRLMCQSNRLFLLRHGKTFDTLYQRIGAYLQNPEPGTLAALCRQASSDDVTRVENQVPHWVFATKDTLAMNVAFALALIVTQRDAERRVRDELPADANRDAAAIDRCAYLEGCVQEAMRLWPTTPFLVRVTVCPDVLGDEAVAPGTQVAIWNSFNHRDPATSPHPDQFQPERWAGRPEDYRFNHLSNGRQSCAGKSLALFLAKATLAEFLTGESFGLLNPIMPGDGPLPHSFNPFRVALRRKPPEAS